MDLKVKRLLRVDKEAVSVKWEVITEYQDDLDPHFPFRMSDSVLNATTTHKSSPVAVAGPTQFSKEMFAHLVPAPMLLLLLVV